MSHISQSTVRNRLLAALSADDFARLLPHLEHVELNLRDVLVEADVPIEHVYFIDSGLGSVVASSPDDEQIEVGHIGWEGMTGKSVVLGVDRTASRTFVQMAGSGFRMRAADLTEAMGASPSLRGLLLRFVHTVGTQVSHTALANGRYNIPERLARWLLMCHDRTEGDDLALTHEFLALMLGVRRSGVTSEIHILEGMRLLRATRGNIRILNRERLEEIAGGCYGLPEREYDRLIGPAPQRH